MLAYLAMRYFGELKMTQLEFQKNLAFELIHNTLESGAEDKRPDRGRNTHQNTLHKITTAPPRSGFECGKWVKKYKQNHQQHKCDTPGCPNFIRTVCNCTKYILRWNLCLMIHIMSSASCDSNFDWIQLAVFHILLVLIITVESKLLVRIYSFLPIFIIEVISRLLKARIK